MKIIVAQIIILLFCFVINCNAQKDKIAFELRLDDNHLYQGVLNFFKIKNENCKALYLTSNNGNVTNHTCNYCIIPKELHQTEICIFKILKGDTTFLEQKVFSIKEPPLSRAEVGGKYEGTIHQKELQVQQGVGARNINHDIIGSINFQVKKFHISVMRDEKLIGKHFNIGGRFDEETKTLLQKIQPKDKVYFVDIYTKHINGEEVKLNAIEFEIVE